MRKNKTIVFANTLWFLEKFKFDLIYSLSKSNTIECIYLRTGPSPDLHRIDFLKSNKVIFRKFNLNTYILFFLNKNIFKFGREKIHIKNIIVFTIGPIVISSIFFANYYDSMIIVLEGLGRVFSSKIIFYRIIKRFIQRVYKFIFTKCNSIIVLNYIDAAYLAEMNLAPINKIKIIPGTGLDIENLEFSNQFKKRPKYIDFISRMLAEKGFYKFILIREYLLNYHYKFAMENPFRIITPQSDIDKLTDKEIDYINKIGIKIKPYIPNPLKYYKESKTIILPTNYGEGLSRVLLESIYLEIPILVSRNAGTEEILPFDYKYFLLSQNPAVISSQLIHINSDKEYFKNVFEIQKSLIRKFYLTHNSVSVFNNLLK